MSKQRNNRNENRRNENELDRNNKQKLDQERVEFAEDNELDNADDVLREALNRRNNNC